MTETNKMVKEKTYVTIKVIKLSLPACCKEILSNLGLKITNKIKLHDVIPCSLHAVLTDYIR